MKKILTTIALFTAVLAISTSCSSTRNSRTETGGTASAPQGSIKSNNDMTDDTYLILSDAQREMAEQNNRFAFNLFRQTPGIGSKVVSPVSVTYLMAMLSNGADSDTRREIAEALGWKDATEQDINEFCQALMAWTGKADPSTTVNTANYIAVNRNVKLKDTFTKQVTRSYSAGIEALDFGSGKTVRHINQWCSDHTQGMIPKIIDALNPSDISCLMNAVYFCGTWTDKFDKKETREEPFRGYTRDIKRVPMMHRNDEYQYTENDTLQMVQIPYGNRNYCMTVLLPKQGHGIDDILSALTPESFRQLGWNTRKYIVDLKLPRFTTEQELPLNDIITKLGAGRMFNASQADFGRFAQGGGFFVSKMLQKAKIEVSEEGTKAAAVTAAIMTMSALTEPPLHVNFHADRPFLYFITDGASGTILFMGQYAGD